MLGESEQHIDSNTKISFQTEKVFLLRLHISVCWKDLDRVSPQNTDNLYFCVLQDLEQGVVVLSGCPGLCRGLWNMSRVEVCFDERLNLGWLILARLPAFPSNDATGFT